MLRLVSSIRKYINSMRRRLNSTAIKRMRARLKPGHFSFLSGLGTRLKSLLHALHNSNFVKPHTRFTEVKTVSPNFCKTPAVEFPIFYKRTVRSTNLLDALQKSKRTLRTSKSKRALRPSTSILHPSHKSVSPNFCNPPTHFEGFTIDSPFF